MGPLRGAVHNAVGQNPEFEAEWRRVAKSAGLPVDIVKAAPDEAKRQAAIAQVNPDSLFGESPALAKWLADQNNANIAHDDVGVLKEIERKARMFAGGAVDGAGLMLRGAGAAMEIGQRNLTNVLADMLPTPRGGAMTPEARAGLSADLAGTDFKRAGQIVSGAARKDIMPGGPQSFGDQVAGGLGQIVSQVPASMLLGPGTLFLQGFGQMDEKVQDDKAPQWKKDLAVLGGGAVTGITEKWALDKLLGPVAEPVKSTLAKALARIGVAGASEGGQEFSENLLQDLLQKGLTNPDQKIGVADAVQAGGVGAAVGAIVRSVVEGALHVRTRGARQEARAQQADQHAQTLGEMVTLAEQSKLRERDPEAFASFAQSLHEGGIEKIYLDPKALAAGGVDMQKLAQAMPSVAAQLERAVESGADLTVPAAEFLHAAPGAEFAQALIEHARTSEDGMSQSQAREYMAQRGQEMQDVIGKALDTQQANEETRAKRDQVRDDFAAQLDAAKRFTPDVNRSYAELVADFYSTQAQRLGISPTEMAQRYPLQVRRDGQAPGKVLEQSAKVGAFGPQFDQFKGDAQGAIDHLMQQRSGEAIGALNHPVLGDIDLVWGEEGTGTTTDTAGLAGEGDTARLSDASEESVDEKLREFEQSARAQITFGDDITQTPSVISLFKGADLSSFLHESGHFFLQAQADLASRIEGRKRGGRVKETVLIPKFKSGVFDAQETLSGLPPVREGFTRLFRAESPTVRFEDVFDKEGLKRTDPSGRPGKFYTDDVAYADYYRSSYGRDAVMSYVDVPSAALSGAEVDANEFVLDLDTISTGEALTEGEQQILDDANITLAWFGIKGDGELSALDLWHSMSVDEQREHHEKFARGFEAYAFEGKAPSLELQGAFQRFRSWLVSIYKKLASLNVELTDDVRGVMDRMLATDQQIQDAKAARDMGPLFDSAEQAGMTPEDWQAYNALGGQATAEAVEQLQARGLRDMQWLRNAHGREVKKLKKQAAGLRAEVEMQVRREVMSQPVYRAWAFLTGKGEQDQAAQPAPRVKKSGDLDPSKDNLFEAIAKMGGLNRDEVHGQWGVDPKDKLKSGVFGHPVLRKSGGLSLDAMTERLVEAGYLLPDEFGKGDVADLEAAFDSQRRGTDVFSVEHDYAERYRAAQGDAPADMLDDHLTHGKLSTEVLREMYGTGDAALWRKLSARRMTSDARGVHPEIVAETFGFSSADEMARALADAESPRDAVKALADARMLQEHGELSSQAAIERLADEAVHNQARAKMVASELAALQRAGSVTEKQGKGHVDLMAKAARSYAAQLISGKRIRDIRPVEFANAAARAGRAALKAMRAGDIETAAAEKRGQLVQTEAERAAVKGREEAEKILRYLRGFDRKGARQSIPTEYLEQIDALLDQYTLRTQSGAQIERTASLRTWVQSRLNAGEIPVISESMLSVEEAAAYKVAVEQRDASGNLVYPDDEERIKLLAEAIERSAVKPVQDATLEELRGLRDTIKQIEHLGRLKDKLLTAKDGKTYAEKRDELAATLVGNARSSGKNVRTSNTLVGRKLARVKQFGVNHIKAATWARIFDGGQDGGAWWNTLIRPANERAAWETTKRAEATGRLMTILQPILKDVPAMDKIGKGKFFPELGTSLNWEERFAIACNYGNESNLQRLMDGGIAGSEQTKTLSMPQIHAVLRSLSEAEWHAVQAVWDHFESYRPEIAAKERRVTGVEPEWIDARRFNVRTSDGKELSLRGGYHPVVFDKATNLQASQHAQAQDGKNAMKAAYGVATTSRSFTKSRVEEVKGRPLLLNLQGLYSGTNDVIHDLAWHEWVVDANKLLKSKTLDAAIREHYGANVKSELEKWRDDIVAGSKRLERAHEAAAGFIRKNVSTAALTFNALSAILQPLGITQSFARVGAGWVSKGVAQYLGNPAEATRMVKGKSEFMENRTRTMFRDLNELRNTVAGQTTAGELMGRYGYFLTAQMQQTVDVPTWIGAYEKAIAGGRDEATAVALADQSVKDSQGGGEEVDQSGISRGGPLLKLFTAFYEFMNTQLNVLYLSASTKSRAAAFWDFALIGVVTPILYEAVKAAATPGDSGDWEDPEEIAKKAVVAVGSNAMGLFAFAREATAMFKSLAGEQSFGYSGPAGVRMFGDGFTFAAQAYQGDLDRAFFRSGLNLIGDLSGIPSVQINRTIRGVTAVVEGETDGLYETVTAPVFGFQKAN